ncbi:hypothetical protein FNV43_RR01854 [Rhamnella rubrinervis]|uniref:Peptidase A1 domain-containing protein n=1 Tax=Rhamnella rubrinervis TaxID=2594499 RepID=A0A8K0HQL2_9ROSA|nr:hypothetical protein FNV43_RR01854 [Rhamnella rubrinervis]
MANPVPVQVLFFFLSLFHAHASTSTTHASKVDVPYTSIILPIRKDVATTQYHTIIDFQISSNPVKATLDLGGQNFWFNCDHINVSTAHPIPCASPKCKTLLDGKPTCTSRSSKAAATTSTCAVSASNSVTGLVVCGQSLYESSISVDTSDGRLYLFSEQLSPFYFACSSPGSSLFQGLAKVSAGLIGLGRSPLALHKQVTSSLNLAPKFAICLPAYDKYYGGSMFIGGGPYYVANRTAAFFSVSLTTTPLVTAPSASNEYFIDVLAIKVDGQPLRFDSSLLSIDNHGVGGTKLSTVNRFTVLHTSIYKALVHEFVSKAAARNITRVASVAPYEACFSVKSTAGTRTGPRVPTIDMVLPGNMNNVVWRIYGVNSMVKAKKDVMCLGFVDGGYNARTSIVLGGHQLEDYLIEFDLSTSRLGFSSSLHLQYTACASASRLF